MTDPAESSAPVLLPESEPCLSGEHHIAPGDVDFEVIYRTHFAFVWRTLRSRGVHDGALDDAVQEVFLVVLRRGAEFEGRANIKTWLYAICIRVASNLRRTMERRRATHESDREVTSMGPGPDVQAQSEQALDFIASFMEGLEEERRTVFQLGVLEEMSAPEVAAITGMNVNTVYTRLRWVKQAFRLEVQGRASK